MPRPPSQPPERDKSPRGPRGDVRGKIVDVLRPKSLSERLEAQAADFIHGRQAYWENDQTNGKSSLTYYVQGDAHEMVKVNEARIARDLEAQKARELEPEFIAAAQGIGPLIERIRSIPEKARDPESIKKLTAFGREVDPAVLDMLRETTRALADAMRPFLTMLENPKEGIAKLVTSADAPTYDSSLLRPVMEEIQLASQRDAQLGEESREYKVTQALEDSPEVWARYRAHLKEDPSRKKIYYYYLLDLLGDFIEELKSLKNLPYLETLFYQISKNYLHFMGNTVAATLGKELDTRAVSSKHIRKKRITEAQRVQSVLEATAACLMVLEINRSLHQIIGSIPLEQRR